MTDALYRRMDNPGESVEHFIEDEVLTQEQAAEIRRRSREGLAALAINIVLLLGISSVVVGIYLLKLRPESSIVVGSIISLAGILSVFRLDPRFNIIANAVSFIGTATFMGGFVWYFVEELDSLTPAILLGVIVAAIAEFALGVGHNPDPCSFVWRSNIAC